MGLLVLGVKWSRETLEVEGGADVADDGAGGLGGVDDERTPGWLEGVELALEERWRHVVIAAAGEAAVELVVSGMQVDDAHAGMAGQQPLAVGTFQRGSGEDGGR
jgi:hypothetical protein